MMIIRHIWMILIWIISIFTVDCFDLQIDRHIDVPNSGFIQISMDDNKHILEHNNNIVEIGLCRARLFRRPICKKFPWAQNVDDDGQTPPLVYADKKERGYYYISLYSSTMSTLQSRVIARSNPFLLYQPVAHKDFVQSVNVKFNEDGGDRVTVSLELKKPLHRTTKFKARVLNSKTRKLIVESKVKIAKKSFDVVRFSFEREKFPSRPFVIEISAYSSWWRRLIKKSKLIFRRMYMGKSESQSLLPAISGKQISFRLASTENSYTIKKSSQSISTSSSSSITPLNSSNNNKNHREAIPSSESNSKYWLEWNQAKEQCYYPSSQSGYTSCGSQVDEDDDNYVPDSLGEYFSDNDSYDDEELIEDIPEIQEIGEVEELEAKDGNEEGEGEGEETEADYLLFSEEYENGKPDSYESKDELYFDQQFTESRDIVQSQEDKLVIINPVQNPKKPKITVTPPPKLDLDQFLSPIPITPKAKKVNPPDPPNTPEIHIKNGRLAYGKPCSEDPVAVRKGEPYARCQFDQSSLLP